MSINDVTGTQNFIQATTLNENSTIMQGAQQLGDSLIGAIDAFLTKVQGAAMDKFTEWGNRAQSFAGNFTSQIGNSAKSEAPMTPRSQQIEAPEKTPQISPDIVASAKQATMAMSSSFAVQDVSSHNFSPSATPNMGFGAMSAGMSV